MEELRSLVTSAKGGDLDAYGEIVRQFQDMAYGYAYSMLGDFHLAEDAAQEAFVEAYRCLYRLREPAAFAGWFRKIVFKHCDRLTRRKHISTVALVSAEVVASRVPGPPQRAEKQEMADRVLDAIGSLPENERTVTTLFYIDGYSQKDIAEFLEVSVTAVTNRLRTSRKRLKERMLTMAGDALKSRRPGPEQRRAIMDELLARRARFDREIVEVIKPDPKWAKRWHDRRMEDVRSNAAHYGIEPDEELPRMLPEYQLCRTFRDDFKDIPRRWGIPPGIQLTLMRELCRDLGARPVALHRWQAEGLPVIPYFPWLAYDSQRAREWVEARGIQSAEKMSAEESREPLLLTLRTLAAGEATIEECKHVLRGLLTSTVSAAGNEVDAGHISVSELEEQKVALDKGELSTFARSQRIVLSNLREVKELSEKEKQLWRDRSALLPKQLRDEIASSQDEKVPEQYRAMVENYFRALSEAGTPRK